MLMQFNNLKKKKIMLHIFKQDNYSQKVLFGSLDNRPDGEGLKFLNGRVNSDFELSPPVFKHLL